MAKQMCQSCGMPLNAKNKGAEADGGTSEKYCGLCYQKGKFTNPNATVEAIQKIGYEALRKKHWPGFLAKMAVNGVPKLERWNRP